VRNEAGPTQSEDLFQGHLFYPPIDQFWPMHKPVFLLSIISKLSGDRHSAIKQVFVCLNKLRSRCPSLSQKFKNILWLTDTTCCNDCQDPDHSKANVDRSLPLLPVAQWSHQGVQSKNAYE